MKIDGEFLSNLRFADDIFLCTETPQELQQMLQELFDESRRMGLQMNIAKTKVMVVDNTPINVNNMLIENVQGNVYLGQHYSLKEKNQDKEIQRRIMAGWAAYAKHRDIFKSNLAICLKRQVERGSSVGRMPDSQSREPGFEPRCYRFEVWAFSFTSRRLSRLSCINEYLAIDSGGNVSE